MALADVEKGVNMFRNPNVNKTILGLVENMAWFTPAEHPDEKYYIFGRDGGAAMAAKYGIPLLGQIPLVQSIREGGETLIYVKTAIICSFSAKVSIFAV